VFIAKAKGYFAAFAQEDAFKHSTIPFTIWVNPSLNLTSLTVVKAGPLCPQVTPPSTSTKPPELAAHIEHNFLRDNQKQLHRGFFTSEALPRNKMQQVVLRELRRELQTRNQNSRPKA
jgi:hypothetical protein